ncbi:MAG: citrate synthase [Leptonema sp. (in: Bacteria)]|nr:citrate synthase [Leptonema sp. (in: bacteria)]
MSDPISCSYKGHTFTLPVISSTDNNEVVSVQQLHEETGLYTFDPALNNTAITKSSVSYIDSKNNKLYYRGYDIEELVAQSSFVETAYLIIYGALPTADELKQFSLGLSKHSMIHESMRNFFDSFPGKSAHPLAILATMVTALSGHYPDSFEQHIKEGVDIRIRLLAKVRTLAAWSYKKSVGQPIVYPRDELPYCTNFLNMMFAIPAEPHIVNPDDDRLLNQLFILYADHEMNATTTTVRVVASARANLFACINAGICSLWGSRESDATMPPALMLLTMVDQNLKPEQYFEKFLQGREQLKLNGFGHSAYDGEDPRARISRQIFHDYLKAHPQHKDDSLIQKGLDVEDFAMNHTVFKELRMYPNVEFYSALIFKMLGIPPEMNNVIRTIGKLAGWLGHWSEAWQDTQRRVYRPRQLYVGELNRAYLAIENR